MSGARTIVVLGAGRVGGLIAEDLAGDDGLRVVAVDRDAAQLQRLRDVEARPADLASAAAVAAAVADAHLVIGAVPGFLGFRTLEAVLSAGKPIVDISFSPEDPRRLDAAARAAGVPVVFDCGVAPGLSNWLCGRSAAALDAVERVEILVGGLPVERRWPFEYTAPFSPTDVVEEYLRPCRMIREGREVVLPALTEVEPVEVDGVGTLEAFNTDGLRSLLTTIEAPHLVEKTLRYPGHAELMRVLRESGFLDDRPLEVAGVEVAPRALSEALLFRAWSQREGEREFTVLRVTVSGCRGEARTTTRWEMIDFGDAGGTASSMARTTGFPCAIVARMIVDGSFDRPGVHPPELLGRDEGLTERLLAELDLRGVSVRQSVDRASD